MQRKARVVAERAEKFLGHAGVEIADALLRERGVEREVRPPADVHRAEAERLVHRDQRVAVPLDARAVAERFFERPPQHDAGILDGVVAVDVPVAHRAKLQAEAAVHGERRHHMVEKADAGGNLHRAAVQTERKLNIRLLCRARHRRHAFHRHIPFCIQAS